MEELDNLPSPKVVLTSSPTLETGFAKDLFVRWAGDGRNSIIFTAPTPPTSLATRVMEIVRDETSNRTVTFHVTRKVFLEGAELALHEAKERRRLRVEAEIKAKEMEDAAMEDMMLGIEDYESEDEGTETEAVAKERTYRYLTVWSVVRRMNG
jgi:cleavage and polyadenylation specificity factor subunit 2